MGGALAVCVVALVLILSAELVLITVKNRVVKKQVLADYGIKLSNGDAENLSEPVKGTGIMYLEDNRALKYDRSTGRADLVEYEYTEKTVQKRATV
jgi:hypothetical protein